MYYGCILITGSSFPNCLDISRGWKCLSFWGNKKLQLPLQFFMIIFFP